MEFLGKISGGVVIFDNGTPPEGSLVRVKVIASVSPLTENAQAPTIWERLMSYSGIVEGLPSDLAKNHNHYIHGAPKK